MKKPFLLVAAAAAALAAGARRRQSHAETESLWRDATADASR